MPKKTFTPEQIVAKLRQIEVLISQGKVVSALIDNQPCAVTALPDERKGERLVALYGHPTITPEELCAKLNGTDLPKLWIPKKDCLTPVGELPILGTGKLDLAQVRRMAQQMAPS